jgi:predicted DNA-binding transcriptional regulator YafY
MAEKKVLSFRYTDHNGQESARTVEPYKLQRAGTGELVLYGFCLEKDGVRLFRLAAMQDCTVDTYAFEPRYPLEDLLDR